MIWKSLFWSNQMRSFVFQMSFVMSIFVSLSSNGGELSKHEQDLFFEYIKRGNALKIEELVSKNPSYLLARSGSPEVLPLQAAIRGKNKDVVSLLLRLGADVNAQDGSARISLHEAALNNDKELIKILVEKGADPMIREKSGQSSLDRIIYNGDIDSLRIFFATGKLRLNEPSPVDDTTPLIAAVRIANLESIEFLISNGGDVNFAMPRRKITPLHFAAMAPPDRPRRLECMKLLMEKRADLKAVDVDGLNVFHRAIRDKNAEMYDLILSKDPSLVNSRDKQGNTPFIAACNLGFHDTIAYLVRKGADTTAINSSNRTGFQSSKNPETRKFLKDLGITK
jgi:ankyrin repeat protein